MPYVLMLLLGLLPAVALAEEPNLDVKRWVGETWCPYGESATRFLHNHIEETDESPAYSWTTPDGEVFVVYVNDKTKAVTLFMLDHANAATCLMSHGFGFQDIRGNKI